MDVVYSPNIGINGKIDGFVVNGRNITEQIKLKEQLIQSEKLSSIGTFVSGVAHELNNPLTVVMGFAQSLQGNKDLPEDIQENLEVIGDASKRTADIVRNLLKFSRKYKAGKENIFIKEVIESTIALQEYHMKADNIEVIKDYTDKFSSVLADTGQLQQVFMNIIVNAIHAIKQTKGEKIFSIKTQVEKGDVIITFENTGHPIPEDKIRKVFDPFFTTKAVGEGTGLGLFVSYGIIRDNGGKIWVENIGDSGVRFTITLPVTVKKDEKIKEVSSEYNVKGISVLHIEDEDKIREWLNNFLSEKGLSISSASNGKEAIKILEENEFDVILSDIKMPEMTGIELGEWLQENRPEYFGRYVLATGAIEPEVEDYCEKYKWNSIMKPFMTGELLHTIQTIGRRK